MMKPKKRLISILLIMVIAFLASYTRAQHSISNHKPDAHATAMVNKTNPVQNAGGTTPVSGSGTAGQVSKWLGNNTLSYVLGDSIITEDKFGKIGIGTTNPTSKLTVNGMIETTLGGLKFPDGTVQTTAGLSSIFHDATLTGNGTNSSPLGIANNGVGTNQLANNAVTSAKIAANAVDTAQLADNSVIASKIASGQVVKSINGLTDNLIFAAGSNITITPVGNTLTIAATGGVSSASNAFQGKITGNWNDGQGIAHGTLAIPAGKRLVVEFISINISLVLGQNVVDSFLTSTVDGNQVDYRLGVNANAAFPVSPFSHTIDKPVHIYADSGSDLAASISRSPASGGASFSISVSGYLIDLP